MNLAKKLCLILLFFVALCAMNSAFAVPLNDKIEAAIRSYIISEKPEWKNEKVIINLNGNESVLAPFYYSDNEKVTVKIPDLYKLTRITPRLLMPVIITTPNKSMNVNLWVRLEVYKSVVCASRKIKKLTVISSMDVQTETKEVALFPNSFFSDINDVVGKSTRIGINEGSIVYDWMIKITPVIKKGASIKINVIGNNVLLQAEGISLEDGQIGDKIKVRRIDSGKTFDAIVVDSESVEVKL